MDWHRLNGIEILRCRRWTANMLAKLYSAAKEPRKEAWALAERAKAEQVMLDLYDKWR
ncbi:MAG: hypothetical protein J7M21_03960 [Planctomycetes bacterium]|nr:hypothetical protein [Planctomycetota bacterium]